MNETWDVMQDLQFLIASDDQLQEELAQVCDIFDSDFVQGSLPEISETPHTTSESSSNGDSDTAKEDIKKTMKRKIEPKVAKPKPQRSSVRQREEILFLRKQINELSAKLQARKTTDLTTFDMSLWEKTAKIESIEKNKAIQENELLRDAVDQQATFIEQMQRVFRKKPRLNTNIDIHSDEWQAYKLAAQASLRETAIHAIADRQYRRMQSAFVKAGVFEREHFLFHIQALPQPNRSYIVEMINHLTLDAPFSVVGSVAWQVFDGELRIDLPDRAMENYERIDPYTVYSKLLLPQKDGEPCHSNTIRKYYVEEDRQVIVSRSVMEDALVPHMTKGSIENRCIWLLVTPIPNNPNQCRFTLLQQLVWPEEDGPKKTDDMDDVVTMMHRVCFSKEVNRPGTLPMTAQMDLSQLPYPSMGAFAERGRRFVRLLKQKVNAAVEEFQDASLS